MKKQVEKDSEVFCSFCKRSNKDPEVSRVIAGPDGVAICRECVLLCVDILTADVEESHNDKPTS